ncbi:MAG: hypothetical protein AABX99_00905 [Nanoarchaeota archaeon]
MSSKLLDVPKIKRETDYIKKIISISDNHFEKNGKRKMSLQELNKLCET